MKKSIQSITYIMLLAPCLLCCAACASTRDAACAPHTASTLLSSAPHHAQFEPWRVDALATPLTGTSLGPIQAGVTQGSATSLDQGYLPSTATIFYRVFRRTWGKFDMSRCDLHPSCSRFALEAARTLPLQLAIPTAFARLLRNHNDPAIDRDARTGKKHDPLTDYTLGLPRHHAHDPSLRATRRRHFWYHHAQSIRRECRP